MALQLLEEESGYPYPDLLGKPPANFVSQNETFIFTPE